MAMTTTTCETQPVTAGVRDETARPDVQEACMFLSDYAAWLLGCGATCIRIEKNVARMAEVWQLEADLIILPSHVHVVVWNRERTRSFSNVERIRRSGISFDVNTRLSALSWAVADRRIGFEETRRLFARDIATRPANKWMVWVLASLANMSFCRLFGGDGVSMLIVLVATLAGYRLKQVMLEDGLDVRLTFFCSAFFSSVIGAAGHVFGWGTTPEIALGTSVLYLIPGIPYINSVSDLLDGHYVSSFSRFMNAAVLTACLSAGLCGGLLLMGIGFLSF